jgi:hypothetical protein
MNRSQPSVPAIPSLRPPHWRFRFSSLLALLALIGFGSVGPAAKAYVFEPGNPKWTQSSVTWVISLGGTRTLSDGSTFDQSGTAALQTWNQYMQSLQLNVVTNDSSPVGKNDGVNSVAFSSSFFGQSFGSNTLAITGYTYYGGSMSEADTLVNTRWTWDSYRGSLRSATDIRRVLIHEIGHALGLDHPDQAGQHVTAIMNSVVSNVDTAVTDDINGIQALYGARSSGGTPTPTPRPSATPTPTPSATPSLRSASISAAPTFIHTGQSATFTISLSSSSSSPVTVNYVAGGTARASLYTLSGTPRQVTIPAGSTSANVTLTVTGRPRRLKTVTLFLATGSGYSLSTTRTGTVTISR